MRGLRKTWVKGERSIVSARDRNGKEVIRTGKNGGPVVQQHVELVLVPKEKKC